MHINNKEVQAVYRGVKLVSAIYRGVKQIYSSGRKPEIGELFYTTVNTQDESGDIDFNIDGWTKMGWDDTANAYVVQITHTNIPPHAFEGTRIDTIRADKSLVFNIGDYAFAESHIKNLNITIGTIGDYAFSHIRYNFSLRLTDDCTHIGNYAFSHSLLKSIVLPNNFTYGNYVFEACPITSISLPSSITVINEGTFNGTQLISIDIPDGVTSFGYGAFGQCMNLTDITLPSALTSIGNFCFEACGNLKKIDARKLDSVPQIEFKTFIGVHDNGTLQVKNPDIWGDWMQTEQYYLGYYGWSCINKPDYLMNCIANFNVARYAVGSIPQSLESTIGRFTGALELVGQGLDVQINDDPYPYIDFYGETGYRYLFDSVDDNIFNVYTGDEDFTVITLTHYGSGLDLFANRNENYSWMLRPNDDNGWRVHTNGDGMRLYNVDNGYYGVVAFTYDHTTRQYQAYNIDPMTMEVLRSRENEIDQDMTKNSSGVIIGDSFYNFNGEGRYSGRFSWLYVSNYHLTLEEINDVINYNKTITVE